MTNFAIARVGKLSTNGKISSANAHNLRTRPVPNANPDAEPPRLLFGSKDLVGAVSAGLAGVKVRRNSVRCSELLLTGSPEAMEKIDLERWASENLTWLKHRYGKNLLQVVFHQDETTPHIHAMILPLNPDGKLSAKRFWGEQKGLAQLQTDYAKAMEPFGLRRGVEGSKAKHETLKRFYSTANAGTPPRLPESPTRPAPEKSARLGWLKAERAVEALRGFRNDWIVWAREVARLLREQATALAVMTERQRRTAEERDKLAARLERGRPDRMLWRLIAKHCPAEFEALAQEAQRRESLVRVAGEARAKARAEAAAAAKVEMVLPPALSISDRRKPDGVKGPPAPSETASVGRPPHPR
jgi:hypothetical protein